MILLLQRTPSPAERSTQVDVPPLHLFPVLARLTGSRTQSKHQKNSTQRYRNHLADHAPDHALPSNAQGGNDQVSKTPQSNEPSRTPLLSKQRQPAISSLTEALLTQDAARFDTLTLTPSVKSAEYKHLPAGQFA